MFSSKANRISRRLTLAFLPALLALVALMLSAARAPNGVITVSWETDGAGTPLRRGQVVDNEYVTGPGVGFVVSATGGEGVAVIFDSATPDVPFGQDPDLGTPNSQHGGPGVCTPSPACLPGAFTNSTPQGNVLIVQEGPIDAGDPVPYVDPVTGDYVLPDDVVGGVITIDFNGPVVPLAMNFLDQEEAESVTVEGFLAGAPVGLPIGVVGLGDNSYEELDISGLGPVDALVVTFDGSGAIATMIYEDVTVTNISLQDFNLAQDGGMGLLILVTFGLLVLTTMGFYLQARAARRDA